MELVVQIIIFVVGLMSTFLANYLAMNKELEKLKNQMETLKEEKKKIERLEQNKYNTATKLAVLESNLENKIQLLTNRFEMIEEMLTRLENKLDSWKV